MTHWFVIIFFFSYLETLRKYPVEPVLTRTCTDSNYRIPDSDNIVISNGTTIYVSVLGIHHNPMYYPNPLEFQPTRFDSPVNRNAYFPFGVGPRHCLGEQMAHMIIKQTIVQLILEFKFSLPPQTVEHEIDFRKKNFMNQIKDIAILVEKRNRVKDLA